MKCHCTAHLLYFVRWSVSPVRCSTHRQAVGMIFVSQVAARGQIIASSVPVQACQAAQLNRQHTPVTKLPWCVSHNALYTPVRPLERPTSLVAVHHAPTVTHPRFLNCDQSVQGTRHGPGPAAFEGWLGLWAPRRKLQHHCQPLIRPPLQLAPWRWLGQISLRRLAHLY